MSLLDATERTDDVVVEAGDPGEPGGSAAPGADGGAAGGGGGGAASWIRLGLIAMSVVGIGVLFGWPLLAIIGALVVSIFFHELGHYLVAKWAGMKVTEFFIGFGPRLWSFRRGETEYGLKAIPAGAYVRIIGMSNLEEVEPGDEARTYSAQPYRKRLPVVLAGPFANFLVALVLLFVSLAVYGQTTSDRWEVGRVVDGSTAAAMGVQPGDRVVEVGGAPVTDWASFGAAVSDTAGTTVDVVVERDGQQLTLTGDMGWRLDAGTAAALPPLDANDAIISVDGQPVAGYAAFAAALAASPTGTAEVVIERTVGESTQRYATDLVVPDELPADGGRGFVGVGPERPVERMGPVQAAGESFTSFGTIVAESVRGVGNFFSPSGLSSYADLLTGGDPEPTEVAPVPELRPVDGGSPVAGAPAASGPTLSEADANRPMSILGIVRLGSQAGETSLFALLQLVIVVNIFLGLFNLLPLPPLDGGHAAVATYEAVRGRLRGRSYRIDMAKLLPVTYVVVFLLVGLFVTSAYLDLTRPVPNPFGP
jgi:RIP metalloprotease RseP